MHFSSLSPDFSFSGSTTESCLKDPPRRTERFEDAPGFHEPSGLWFYGNVRLLQGDLKCLLSSIGHGDWHPRDLDELELDAEIHVLAGRTIVSGIHHQAHQRIATVSLRWGAPRVIVFSGGFYYHLGRNLTSEPFRAARLWRYQWDAKTDLAVSRRAPDKLPTYSNYNPTVDRVIAGLANKTWPGLFGPTNTLAPHCLRQE